LPRSIRGTHATVIGACRFVLAPLRLAGGGVAGVVQAALIGRFGERVA